MGASFLDRARRGARSARHIIRRDLLAHVAATGILGITAIVVGGALLWHVLAYAIDSFPDLPRWWRPWDDGTVPEAIEGVWMVGASTLLLVSSLRRRSPHLAAWTAALIVLTGDNLGRWHEQFGRLVGPTLDKFSLGPVHGRHLGEIAFLLVIGGLIVGALVITYRGSPEPVRDTSALLFALCVVLGFCAVVVDALHVVTASKLAAFAEDGGEMVLLALLACVALAAARTPVSTPPEPKSEH